MAKIIAETERVILRELEITDASFIFELLNSPGWLQFIGDRNIKTIADAENYIKNGPQASYSSNGFGLWLVFEKKINEPIGICGLLKRDYLAYEDIGYAFLPQFFGNGYAIEATKITCEYALDQLKKVRIMAIVQEKNTRSINLLYKLGFNFLENKTINEEVLNVFLK